MIINNRPHIEFVKKTLSITFESQEEVETFYAIFDYAPIATYIDNNTKEGTCEVIRNEIEDLYQVDANKAFDKLLIQMNKK